MKIPRHLSHFRTFFKESSFVMQLAIIASAIGIIAGTASVAAMVTAPENNEVSSNITTSESSEAANYTDIQTPTSNEEEQKTDTGTTTAPQANETTTPNNTQSTPQNSTSNDSQQEAQPQTPAQPAYTDSYPFKADCSNNPQQTSTQIDSWGYNKCYSSSYTAWKVHEKYGAAPLNWGDPRNWLQAADNANIPRGNTPKQHSVGIQTTSGAGWSVWIEAVNDDGTVDISYYNFNNNLAYGKQYGVSSSAISNYIYFGE